MNFIGIFFLFPAVKEIWKPVTIWQSYARELGGCLFIGTVLFVTNLNFLLLEVVQQRA